MCPSNGASVTGSGIYIGSVVQGVDRKGRVAIPADFRAAIEANSSARIVMVTFHNRLPCLRGFDAQWALDTETGFRQRLAAGEDEDQIARERESIFGEPEQAQFDPSGRFNLSEFLRSEMGITDRALFTGAGNTFNIWSPERFIAHPETTDRMRRRCELLMAGKPRE